MLEDLMLSFDAVTDVLYVSFATVEPGGVKRSRQLDDVRLVDYDADGEVVGVEFLGASEGIDLEEVPRADEIRRLLATVTSFHVAA